MNNLTMIDDQDNISDINVEDKCVYYGHSLCAECVVRYVGEIDGKQGRYYGIEFTSPIGMNDGSVDGKSYFNCAPKHGLFVKNYRLKRIEDSPAPLGGIWSKLMKGIDVGTRVVVNGGFEGIVITIFHWFTEERRANKPVMCGVLLDKRKGNSDGTYQGVRHFFCEQGRGLFVENFEVRLQASRATIGFGETRGLSRANSIKSINSNVSEWRNPAPYFASNRVTRSPALSTSRDRPGLKTQLNCRTTTASYRPSIAMEENSSASDKREIASLKNVIDELTKDQTVKNEELQKHEAEILALKSELEGVNFELLECRAIFNSLGIGNVPESGNAEATPNLFVRTSKLIALMCLHLSRTYPHEKENLTALFNSLFTVPNSTSIGALPTTIAINNCVQKVDQVISGLADKERKTTPTKQDDLILKVPTDVPSTPTNSEQNTSVSSNILLNALESLQLKDSPARMNGGD